MKTEIIYTETRSNEKQSFTEMILNNQIVLFFAAFFSYTLERKINAKQTLHLLHAHISFTALLLMGGISAFVAVLLLIWFAVSVLQCAKSLSL